MWKNRIVYGGILLLAVFLLLFYHHYFFFVLAILLVVFPFFSVEIARRVAGALEIEVQVPVMTIEQNNYVGMVFHINNKLRIPLPALVCRFSIENRFYENAEVQEITFPLCGSPKNYQWSICPIYAGSIRIQALKAYVWDYLHFCEIEVSLPKEKEIFAFPQKSVTVVPLLEAFREEGEEVEKDAMNSVEDVTSIKELRDYRPGDRLQRVHWKLSTKQEGLLVKEFERELDRTVSLLVEIKKDGVSNGNLDCTLRAMYSVAGYMLEEEQIFQLQWFDVKKNVLVSVRIDSRDRLEDSIQEMFRCNAYEEDLAYRKYREAEQKELDRTIYFVPEGRERDSSWQLLGVFEKKVWIVCL